MDDTMKSCREFVAVLASSAPAPGGGGAAALAAALGWAGETGEDGVLRLSDGRHKIELPVGRRALLDGMTIRLSGPTVERGGGRCLPLSDLCPLLGVQATVTDQGEELAPRQAAL